MSDRKLYSQQEITEALTAMVAFAGNAHETERFLKSEGKRAPSWMTLLKWSRTTHFEEYNRIRDQVAALLEADLAGEYRDIARMAVQAERIAVQKATERLESGEDQDPARSAANLATVAQKSTDKLLSLTGRPQQITEHRDITAIIRSLVAKGVASLPEGPEEIER
jgi:hypothetical protein